MTATLVRTDIHRPSAINPLDYQYVGVEYAKIEDIGDCLFLMGERQHIQAHMKRTGGDYSRHEHGGNCHVCGAHCIYTALFYHADTNTYIRTGFDCADKMGGGDEAAFATARRSVEEAREAQAGKRKAKALLTAAGLVRAWELYSININSPEGQAELVAAGAGEIKEVTIDSCPTCIGKAHRDRANCPGCCGWGAHEKFERKAVQFVPGEEYYTLLDLIHKLIKWGSISDKQMRFVGVLVNKMAKRNEIAAQRAEQKAAAAEVPEGRITISGEVLKAEWRQGQFGSELKITVKHASGYIVWGTAPTALRNPREVQRGDKVTFTGTVSKSPTDTKFGFFKRPSGGTYDC